MSDNELLIAISQMLDAKLKPLMEKQRKTELILENDILPRLQNIEACYTGTYNRYETETSKIEAMEMDIDVMKKVIKEHSDKLNRIA